MDKTTYVGRVGIRVEADRLQSDEAKARWVEQTVAFSARTFGLTIPIDTVRVAEVETNGAAWVHLTSEIVMVDGERRAVLPRGEA